MSIAARLSRRDMHIGDPSGPGMLMCAMEMCPRGNQSTFPATAMTRTLRAIQATEASAASVKAKGRPPNSHQRIETGAFVMSVCHTHQAAGASRNTV